MVELRTGKGEMRGDGGNHYEKLGRKRILCASQFTITDRAGMSPDPACNNPDMMFSQPNQASHIPDRSCLLISSRSFSSSSLSLSFSSTTLPSLQNTTLSHLSISLQVIILSLHRVQAYTEYKHTPSTSIHWVETYTEHSIHWVLHQPKIVCLPFIFMIKSWPLNVAWVSRVPPYTIDHHQPALHESSRVKSACHIPMVAS